MATPNGPMLPCYHCGQQSWIFPVILYSGQINTIKCSVCNSELGIYIAAQIPPEGMEEGH